MQIKNYNYPTMLFDVCTAEEQISDLIAKKHNALYLGEDAFILNVDGQTTELEFMPNNMEDFETGDVVMINSDGRMTQLFNGNTEYHTLVVTNRCNSNCIMCPYTSQYRKNYVDPDFSFLMDCVKYLPKSTRHIVITGGEPTLIGEPFFEVMDLIRKRFPDVQCLLLTNGRAFSVESMVMSAIDAFPAMTQIAIPLHAASAELHNMISQSSNSFEQTMAGIKRLLNAGFKIEIRIVVFKRNVEEMENIADLIVEQFPKAALVNFMAAEMCGNAGINSYEVWLNYNTAFQKCEKAIDILINEGIDVGLYNFPLCSVPEKYWGIYKKSISDYKIRYPGKCEECTKKELCGGIFASSMRYGKEDVVPFK